MVLQQFANVKVLFLDVDGVLTDGSVLVTEQGEQLRRFSIKDGYAIQLAVKCGLRICIISGGNSQGVLHRLRGLGVQDVYLGVSKSEEHTSELQSRENIVCRLLLEIKKTDG